MFVTFDDFFLTSRIFQMLVIGADIMISLMKPL